MQQQHRFALLIVGASLICTGCASSPGSTTAAGTLLGAASGAAIGSLSGDAGKGALIGAGVGTIGGYTLESHQARQQSYYSAPASRACPAGFYLDRTGSCVR